MPSETSAKEDAVKQHYSAQSGRHLRASEFVSAGKRILQEEAVAAVLYDDGVAKRCHTSFKITQSPLRCGGCKFARYASRDDQRLAWQLGHREECAALQACSPNVPPATVRLVARLCWRRDRCGFCSLHVTPASRSNLACCSCRLKAQAPACTDVNDVDSLEHHWGDLPDSKKQLYAQMAALTRCAFCFSNYAPFILIASSSTQALT